MTELSIYDICVRLALTLLASGIIGMEREVNESNAGLKTHILVGIGSAIISLIQASLVIHSVNFAIENPELKGIVSADSGRLIAQIVSGIGFLGAGTIIVTRRRISGLTTAASIWSVASIGMAIGMGLYEVGIIGLVFVFIVLFFLKRFIHISVPERLVIRYLHSTDILHEIEQEFQAMGAHAEPIRYDTKVLRGETLVHTSVFKIDNPEKFSFEDFVRKMSTKQNIISVERTNLND